MWWLFKNGRLSIVEMSSGRGSPVHLDKRIRVKSPSKEVDWSALPREMGLRIYKTALNEQKPAAVTISDNYNPSVPIEKKSQVERELRALEQRRGNQGETVKFEFKLKETVFNLLYTHEVFEAMYNNTNYEDVYMFTLNRPMPIGALSPPTETVATFPIKLVTDLKGNRTFTVTAVEVFGVASKTENDKNMEALMRAVVYIKAYFPFIKFDLASETEVTYVKPAYVEGSTYYNPRPEIMSPERRDRIIKEVLEGKLV